VDKWESSENRNELKLRKNSSTFYFFFDRVNNRGNWKYISHGLSKEITAEMPLLKATEYNTTQIEG